MHSYTRLRSLVVHSLAVGVLLVGGQLCAQDGSERLSAPKLFPEGTLAYLRIDNVAQLKDDLARSSIGKLGNDEQIKPIIAEFYGSLVRFTEAMQSAVGLNLDELLSIPSGEFAIALLPNDRGEASFERQRRDDEEGGRSEQVAVTIAGPAFAVLLDAGDEISSVKVMLERIDRQASQNFEYSSKEVEGLTLHRYDNPDRRNQHFAYFIDGSTIVACTDADYIETLAKVWLSGGVGTSSLADNRKFTTILARCVGTAGERPQVSYYVDPMGIVKQFIPKSATTAFGLSMLSALGIDGDGIQAAGGSWIVSPPDFDSIGHNHLLLGTPRRGVMALLRPKSGSTDPESWVPDTVAAYMTINWDFDSTVLAVERIFNQFRGDDAFENEVLARVKERTEIDLKRDVLDNLQGRFTLCQGFVRPIRINSGSNVYAVKLKDVDRFERDVLPKLIDLIGRRIEVSSFSVGKLKAQMIQVPNRGPAANSDQIRPVEICIAIVDDYVVISDSKYMMMQVADCYGGTGATLKDALEYQLIADRVDAQLQDKEAAALQYSRPEESLQLFYELARDPGNQAHMKKLAANNPFFKALVEALDKHELPPFAVISKYLAPTGGFIVDEETGIHMMTFGLRRD